MMHLDLPTGGADARKAMVLGKKEAPRLEFDSKFSDHFCIIPGQKLG
jgi:hypothetical protein